MSFGRAGPLMFALGMLALGVIRWRTLPAGESCLTTVF